MKRRTVKVLVACGFLFVLAGRAPAELVIDESFDACPGIQTVQSVGIGMMTMGMWMGGETPSSGYWWYENAGMGGHAMGSLMGTGMGMAGMSAWSTLTYFVAKPAHGWGGNRLDLSFDFQYSTASPADTEAKFGVYGWPEGAPVGLMVEFPGADGTELGASRLSPSAQWNHVTQTYLNTFTRSEYIGVTFTIGDRTGAFVQGELAVDNVKVNIIPEPSTLLLSSLGMATAVWIRRRCKKRRLKEATGPPG